MSSFVQEAEQVPGLVQTSVVSEFASSHWMSVEQETVQGVFVQEAEQVPGLVQTSVVSEFASSQSELLLHSMSQRA